MTGPRRRRLRAGVLVGLFVAAALASGCSKDVDGSGTAKAETRAIEGFSEVELKGEMQLEITLGKPHSVEVRGDDNLVPLVTTKRDGARLVLATTQDVDPKLPLVVAITAPDLSAVIASGVAKVRIEGVSNEAFRVNASGVASFVIKGKTTAFEVDLSGAGGVDALGLDAERVLAVVSGAGSIDVTAHQSLEARVSGAGSVHYAGEPKELKQEVSGAGSVSKK